LPLLAWCRSIPVAIVASLGWLVTPSLANAGTVTLDSEQLTFTAAAGEANHVLIFRVSSGFRVIDGGAALTPAAGCSAVDTNEAICAIAAPAERWIGVVAGDLDDFVAVSAFSGGAKISGGDGVDVLEVDVTCFFCPGAFGFSNSLDGGPGNDTLRGGIGDDALDGGLGADVLSGGGSSDCISYAARVNPVVVDLDGSDGEAGEGDAIANDVECVIGGSGDDTISGGSNVVQIQGRAGDDTLNSLSSPLTQLMTLDGDLGDDVLIGGSGLDNLTGGPGRDTLTGRGFEDTLWGGDGPDILRGGGRRDRIFGGGGNDLLVGGPGRDFMSGDAANDTFWARDDTRDRVRGVAGFDRARVDRRLDVVTTIEAFF
jgi:Ca2+-binding RTX toxin-like protein